LSSPQIVSQTLLCYCGKNLQHFSAIQGVYENYIAFTFWEIGSNGLKIEARIG